MTKKQGLTRREMLKLTAAGAAGLAVGIESSSVFADAPARQNVKIRVQANTTAYEEPIAALLNSTHPNIEVEFLEVTGIDHEEVASKILAMIAAGEPLDVGYAATEATQLYAGQELAAPLKDRVLADEEFCQDLFSDMHPSLVEAMMYEGDLYELPRDFNAANMYFNMNLLAENGIDLPPENWTKDDFYNIASATTKKNSAGETEIFGYGWTNRLWGSWMPWIFVAGGNLFTEDRAPGGEWLWDKFYAGDRAAEGRGGGFRWITPVANSPEVVEALEFVVQLWKEGITPALAMGTGETLTGFYSTGKLGMTPAGGFWAGHLKTLGMAYGDFDVQLWPAWRNQKHQFGTGGKWLATMSKHPDEAWEYIKAEVSREGFDVHGFYHPYIITTPTRRSYCNAQAFAESGPPHWSVFYDTLDKHPDTSPIPAPPWSVAETSIFTRYTGVALTGEMEPKEALDKMQGELEDLVKRQPTYYGED